MGYGFHVDIYELLLIGIDMPLPYAYLRNEAPPAPQNRANGGLYTGSVASGDWGNVPVIPEAHILVTQNLKSAGPPPGAITQPAGYLRPGNNSSIQFPYHMSVPEYGGLYVRDDAVSL